MKINLDLIKASTKPIRSSWDEESMVNLKWSLMEEGQVEPIGVHENGKGYIIVWGHRRVEAARRAGWDEIEAVIVLRDEVNNLIQAGIENLAGEDMSADDKAEWAFRLTELGLSQHEISRRSTKPRGTITDWLTYRQEKSSGVVVTHQTTGQDQGVNKTIIIKKILGDDVESKKEVAEKVSIEKLTQDQTRAVAEAYRDAPTPEVKAAILKQPIISRDTAADILRRSIYQSEVDTGIKYLRNIDEKVKEEEKKDTYETFDFVVKDCLTDIKKFGDKVGTYFELLRFGKFSPEAARFTSRRVNELIDSLKTFQENLERCGNGKSK
jgi:ParB family chromosome partitioning protein